MIQAKGDRCTINHRNSAGSFGYLSLVVSLLRLKSYRKGIVGLPNKIKKS